MHPRITMGLFAFCAAVPLFAAPKQINPGMWEITLRTVSPQTAPAMTVVRCISAEEVETLAAPSTAATEDCQVTGGVTGNVLAYTVKCAIRNTETQTRFVFAGDHYTGTVDITHEGHTINQTYNAKRVGDCPAVTGPEVRK